MASKNKFNNLFLKYKNEICMKESGKYSINKENVNKYIENSCIISSHNLLNFVFNNIKYITFHEFYSSLEKYILEINKTHRRDNNDMIIKAHIIIPNFEYIDITNTSLWVSLLIQKIIDDNSIKFEIFNIITDFNYFTTLGDDHILIFADDCEYDGEKVNSNILNNRRITFTNKIYIVIPYISNYARNVIRINSIKKKIDISTNIVFLHDFITYLEMFTEICIKEDFNIYKNDIYYVYPFEYNKMITGKDHKISSLVKDTIQLPYTGLMVYFDHQIMDKSWQSPTISNFLRKSRILQGVHLYNIIDNRMAEDAFVTLKERYNLEFSNLNNINDLKYFANEYNKDYLSYVKNNFIISEKEIICIRDYETIINSCDNKLLENCLPTFYKQKDFYIQSSIGGYYKKYLNTKNTYLQFKNKSSI